MAQGKIISHKHSSNSGKKLPRIRELCTATAMILAILFVGSGQASAQFMCPPGQEPDPSMTFCQPITCPAGQELDPSMTFCQPITCPAGQELDPSMTFCQPITCPAGQVLNPTTFVCEVVDVTPPTLTSVTATTNNAFNAFQARVGDTITVSVSTDEALAFAPSINIAGNPASVTGAGTNWTGTLVVTSSVPSDGTALVSVFNAQDAAGNTASSVNGVTSGSNVTVDNTDLQASNIFRNSPVTETTDADSLEFLVIFPDGAFDVTTADFAVSGTTTATVTSAVAEGGNIARYLVTVSGGDLANFNGVVGLDLRSSGAARDRAGNPLNTAVTGSAFTYTVANDSTAPQVTSIVRTAPASESTNVDSVTWTVTFSEDVQNVTGDDFSLSGTSASAFINQVSASVYEVTASAGLGGGLPDTGTVTLSFDAGQDIADTAGNALSNTVRTGANENSYNFDNTVPLLASITRVDSTTEAPVGSVTNADSIAWNLQFSSITTSGEFNLQPSDFALSGTTASLTVTRYSIGFIVRASGGDLADLDGDVTLGFAATTPTDEFGNEFTNKTPTGVNEDTYTLDNTAPTITQVNVSIGTTNSSSPTIVLGLSEAGELRIAGGVSLGAAGLRGCGQSGGDQQFAAGDQTITLELTREGVHTCQAFLTDEAGNTSPLENLVLFTFDQTAPTVVSIVRNDPTTETTDSDTLSWIVTFSENFGSLPPDAFSISGSTADVAIAPVTTGSGIMSVSQTTFEVSASGGDLADLNDTVTLSVNSTLADPAGNTLASTTPTGTDESSYTVSNITEQTITFPAPDLSYGTVLDLSTTASASSGLDVLFMTYSDPSICEISGTTLTANALGTCQIVATQPGDATFSAATEIIHDVVIGRRPITVTPDARSKDFGTVLDLGTSLFTVVDADADNILPFGESIDSVTMESAIGVFVNGTFDGAADPASEPFAEARTYFGNISITDVTGSGGFDETNYDIRFGSADLTITDASPPTLVSITREDPTTLLTNSDTLEWIFEFSEPVSNVQSGDFTLTGTTATVSSVTASGSVPATTYSVEVSGGDLASLDGTVEINLTVGGRTEIVDANNNLLEASGATPSGTNENSYELDNSTAPEILSIVRQDPLDLQTAEDELTWRVTFNEAVENVDATDFTVSGTTAAISVSSISEEIYDILISGGDLVDLNATVTLSIASGQDIADSNENTLTNGVPTGTNENTFDVQNDVTPPSLTITGVPESVDGPFDVTFTFTENVVGFTEEDVIVTNGTTSNFRVGGQAAPQENAKQQSSDAGASTYFVTVTPEGDGDLTITVSEETLSDVAGNLNVAETVAATVIDSTSPSVVIDPLPADVRGQFTATVRFDEDVEGFELADIQLSNASGSDFAALSASDYTLLVTPSSHGAVTVDIAANVAQDLAGNPNTAAETVSTEFIDEVFVRTRTSSIIGNFLARRADQITINDPDLSRRLTDEAGAGQVTGDGTHGNIQLGFNGKASGEDAGLAKLIGKKAAEAVNVWTEFLLSSVNSGDDELDFLLLHAGVDYRISENTLVGIMGEYDWADESNQTQGYEISGQGWMIGPYVVSRLRDDLIFDGRVSWGQSSNEVAPFLSYSDDFDTNRGFAKGQLTGDFTVDDWNIHPALSVTYFQEEQETYTDSLGIVIPDQTVELGRLTFGPRFSKEFQRKSGMTLSPSFNFRGVWDFEQPEILDINTGLGTSTDELRARTEFGITSRMPNGLRLTLDGYYDGIGTSEYESYGTRLGFNVPLQ